MIIIKIILLLLFHVKFIFDSIYIKHICTSQTDYRWSFFQRLKDLLSEAEAHYCTTVLPPLLLMHQYDGVVPEVQS